MSSRTHDAELEAPGLVRCAACGHVTNVLGERCPVCGRLYDDANEPLSRDIEALFPGVFPGVPFS
jgi:ribosomal protein L32